MRVNRGNQIAGLHATLFSTLGGEREGETMDTGIDAKITRKIIQLNGLCP